jgi:hypothetical protein
MNDSLERKPNPSTEVTTQRRVRKIKPAAAAVVCFE